MTMSNSGKRMEPRPFFSYNVAEEHLEKSASQLTARDIAVGLATTTTMHGIPNSYSAYGYGKKIFWILATLTMTGICLANVSYNLQTYLSWDVSVDIGITSMREIDFPGVTVCNSNALRGSAISSSFQAILSNVSFTNTANDPGPTNQEDNVGLGTSKSSRLSLQEIVIELLAAMEPATRESYGYQFSDFILSCTFAGYDCSSPKLWEYVYNAKYGNCFTFNVNSSVPTLVSNRPGADYGLTLILNTDQDEYLPALTDTVGGRILVHDVYNMPLPDLDGFHLPPGFVSSIGLRKMDVSRLGGNYGDCHDTTVKDATINVFEEQYPWTNYTLPACQLTCWQKMVIHQCGCFDAHYPSKGVAFKDSSTPPCSAFNVTQVQCKAIQQIIYLSDESCLECNEPCNQTLYTTVLSMGVWPAPSYQKLLLDSLGNSSAIEDFKTGNKSVTDNLIKVEVYFEELNYEFISESPAYDLSSFASDLGGAVGLWLGASVLSAGELLEFIVDLIVLYVRKCCFRGDKARTVSVQSIPENKVM